MITELEFQSLARAGYHRIPLVTEAFADLETPLSLYLKLAHAHGDGTEQLFAGIPVEGGERFGRYSFIRLPARTLLRASGLSSRGDRPKSSPTAKWWRRTTATRLDFSRRLPSSA